MEIITRVDLLKKLGLPPDPEDPVLKMVAPEARKQYLASMAPPKSYYEIDADARLYLLVDDDEDGFRRAFAEEFQKSWGRVKDDQPAMVEFWRSKGQEVPTIQLEWGLSLIGKYDRKDFLFGFNTEGMRKACDDGVLGDVIGHELGHGFCHIDPKSFMSIEDKITQEIVTGRENEANAKAQSWGFDMKKLEEWGNANRKLFAEITKNPAYLNPFTPVV